MKFKFDAKHRKEAFKRVRIDIAHFDLDKAPEIYNENSISPVTQQKEEIKAGPSDFKIVAIAKHLCGGATDICLTSLTRDDLKNVQPTGVLIAPCCHHSCDLRTYVNVQYLEELGLEKKEAVKLFAATMWANSGAINKKKQEEMSELGVTSKERTCMGFVAKRIINIGRILYMKSKGYDVTLKKYCKLEYSPENLIIVCHKLPS
eukprot:TRINITY_DN3725_c0_g1_i2.p1 TRINITY_DN3725_c0_g1~~TRINITY_DN3725_c0_g1_i2.p1  ORF type:complete len:204 (-),score=55.02 TRINITY_DN3725_c0_g1_i2:54-665(-)